jgi:hypothetical protein
MRLSSGLRFDGSEELGGRHLNRSLKHALTDTCDCAANLYFSGVLNYGHAVPLLEVNISSALEKARLTLAVHEHAKVKRRLHVFEANVTGEEAFDRTNPGA